MINTFYTLQNASLFQNLLTRHAFSNFMDAIVVRKMRRAGPHDLEARDDLHDYEPRLLKIAGITGQPEYVRRPSGGDWVGI